MDAEPARTAARRRRRTERLGPECACALCGERDPVVLIAVSRTLLQGHHVFGRKRDPECTVILCRNCHAKVTEELLKAGIPMVRECDPQKRVAYSHRDLLASQTHDGSHEMVAVVPSFG